MKKNILYISLFFFTLTISSCKEDVEIWDSNTLGYSGTYFWELFSEDMADVYVGYDNAVQLMIYNTSANKENEVWIEDTDGVFPLKSKFTLDGTPESFKSISMNFADLENNLLAIELPDDKPTGLSQEVTEERGYIRNVILEGKILRNAGTTTSGNPVDSLYIKIKLLSGTVKFTSKAVPVELRADPEVEQFEWKYSNATYDNTLDEIYVISGHRKTGFSEDDH